MKIVYILALLNLAACGHIQNFDFFASDRDLAYDLPNPYREFSEKDYVEQYNHISKTFLESGRVKIVRFPSRQLVYLRGLVESLRENNELLFKNNEDIDFYLISHKAPFYFSSPEGKVFLSLGVMKRYMKNEGSLAAILLYESIRIEKDIYRKNFFIPTGTVSVERMISFSRIDLLQKNRLNKWVYYGLDRSGFDAENFLDWIQLQNKNSLDFALHLGSMKEIVREESELRRFILRKYQGENLKNETRSSKDFYRFMQYIRRL